MSLSVLVLVVFFGAHLGFEVVRGARAALIEKIGAGAYKGLYSLVSIAGFALIIIGWRNADATVLYVAPYWLVHVTYLLMLIALILLVSAYAPPGRIAAAAKHPMLAAVKIWAFAHLLVNGDVRSLMLFGSFLAFAVIDRILLKKRGEPTPVAKGATGDVIAVVVGAAAWAAIYFYLHRYIAGVPLH